MTTFARNWSAIALSIALGSIAPRAAAEEAEKCVGTPAPGQSAPTPADPYPLMAAGWGPELGNGLMASRWAEDWSGVADAGHAAPGKAAAMGNAGHLTLGGEIRLRTVASDNAQLVAGRDVRQNQLRAVVGAHWIPGPHVRAYAELGAGRVDDGQAVAPANFQNDAALQQIFVDLRASPGDVMFGAMFGRQEFSDGPRQLISLSDGPNLHRTWNGVRLYGHGPRMRLGAFDFKATRLGGGALDETVNSGERLRGLTGSFIVTPGHGPNTYLDPFWYRTDNNAYRVAGVPGMDHRDTYGARLWGRAGQFRFDWTAARQTGDTVNGRPVDAWALFTVQSLALSESGWKPRLTSHVDVASGGGAFDGRSVRDFNPLYASSNYLGEGQFLGLTNLMIVAPGIAVAPTHKTSVTLEYGYARRLDEKDAIYAGGGCVYGGTERTSGHYIGGLARLTGTWSANRYLSFRLNVEHLRAGGALQRAGFTSGTYAYLDATVRY